jgi:hypothetical protein
MTAGIRSTGVLILVLSFPGDFVRVLSVVTFVLSSLNCGFVPFGV